MNIRESGRKEIGKDRKTILKKERLKKEKLVDVWKTRADNSLTSTDSSRKRKKEKLLREVMVKIRLKDNDDEIVVETLLDSCQEWKKWT